MTTIVTIIPIIPVGPRISSRSFPRESQRTAARSALSPSWVGGRHAAQYSTRRDRSARQPEPSAVVPDESSCFNIGDIESRLPLMTPLDGGCRDNRPDAVLPALSRREVEFIRSRRDRLEDRGHTFSAESTSVS